MVTSWVSVFIEVDVFIEEVDEYKIRWREHVLYVGKGCVPKTAYFYALHGSRNVRRPIKRLSDFQLN